MKNYYSDSDCVAEYPSPIGILRIVSDGEKIKGLLFASDGQALRFANDGTHLPCVKTAINWLNMYFAGKIPDFTPDLDYSGVSPFMAEVFEELKLIPYGETVTYGYIAKRIGSRRGIRMSAQAVGGALNRNPLPVFLPCHRVLGANNALVGFGGGLDVKAFLLSLEQRNRGY